MVSPGFGAWPEPGGSSGIPDCLEPSQDSLQAQHSVGPKSALAFHDPHVEQEQLGTEIFQQLSFPQSLSPVFLAHQAVIPRKSSVPGAPEGLQRRCLLLRKLLSPVPQGKEVPAVAVTSWPR